MRQKKFRVARAEIVVGLGVFEADVAEQTSQQRAMDLLIGCRGFIQPHAHFRDQRMQLLMYVAPFAQASEGQKMFVAKFGKLAIGFFVLDRIFEEIPNLQIAQEIGAFFEEQAMFFQRRFAFFLRPLAWVLHRQRCRENEHFAQAIFGLSR